jgi:hypothetical protein
MRLSDCRIRPDGLGTISLREHQRSLHGATRHGFGLRITGGQQDLRLLCS